MRTMKWVAAALPALALGSCGPPYANFSSFCDAYATAWCSRLDACGASIQDCTYMVSGEVCYCGMNAFQDGSESYHSDKVQACLDAVPSQPCAMLGSDQAPAACSLVYGLPAGAKIGCPIVIGPMDGGSD